MDKLHIDELAELRRDALVQYILGQKAWEGAVALLTPNDLYEYLMTDPQDSAKLQATWVSALVRCLQQHIQAVYSGMEPGYEDSHFDEEDLQHWYQILSHYGTWAGNQMLMDYAENYIVPSLRLKKTALFKALENSLNQMRLSTGSVQLALQEYLQSFQRTCDLEVISGYIDGGNYQDAPYYFIGRERTPPHAYYWRKARVELTDTTPTLNPTAWGEWQLIDTGATGKVLDIRPVHCGGRLMLVWCEWRDRQLDSEGRVSVPWSLEIKVTHAGLNGQWSPPMTLHQRDCDHDVSKGRMTAVVFGGGDPRADRLAVCYTNRSSLTAVSALKDIEIHVNLDTMFRKVADDRLAMLALTFARFQSPDTLQHKILPTDLSPITIGFTKDVEGSINDQLSLEVIHTREADGGKVWDVLRVRGRCDAVREDRRAIKTLSIGWQGRASVTTPVFDIRLVEAGEDRLTVTFSTSAKPAAALELKFNAVLFHSFAVADFKETEAGTDVWVATAVTKKLSAAQLSALMVMTPEKILTGAGFSVPLLGETLANETNQLVPKIFYAAAPFILSFSARTVIDPPDWTATGELNGDFATPWLVYRRDIAAVSTLATFPIDSPMAFTFGVVGSDLAYGRNGYQVTLTRASQLYDIPSIDNSNPDAAQFLSFNKSAQALKFVRLNSKFGPVLVERAAISTDAVLAWDIQHVEEPPLPNGTVETNGPFDGCNGLFFWELFFHLPDLVGSRLMEEGRFREAQGWFEYIFNPLARAIEADPDDLDVIPAPPFWRCRPLNIPLNPAYEAFAPHDPDAIGYTAPVHMQIAIFMRYVRNLIAWGDGLYRQLSRDSMVAAKLCYVRALSLMGEEPDVRTANAWTPAKLEDLLEQIRGREDLKAFEAAFDLHQAEVPLGMSATPRLGLLGSGVFRPPVNEQLIAVWAILKQRLANLRNDLTIDGKPLSIPLFDAPVEPLDLLRAQGQGNSGVPRNPGGQVQVVPHRWRVMHEMALRGVQALAEYGDQVRLCLEQRDRGQQEELQQKQMLELGSYARTVQMETIAQLVATEASLRQSEVMVKARADHYTKLADPKEGGGVSQAEYDVLEKTLLAKSVGLGAAALQTVGAGLDVLPNIFGVAAGGYRLAAIPYAIGYGIQVAVDALLIEAEETGINEQYRRRQVEWELARDQAGLEAQTLRKQIEAQRHAINAARASLEQTDLANAHAQQLFAFYKNRSTSQALYSWMLGQMKTLYFQLYDAVVALCLSAETCWQYEMGDYQERFIRPDVWLDTFHGLTAAYSLKLDLLKMESAYLKRNERRIELVKTISLKTLLEGGSEDDKKHWKELLAGDRGTLDFTLGQKCFDKDYPGHYCRQISSVAITFPAVLAPYQDVRALLMQVGSYTATQPTLDSVKYLHELPSSDPIPLGVILNVRPHQQIGVSKGLEDNGIVMDFDNSRYQPFEGTGAVSTWRLTFPRHGDTPQQTLLNSLTDIILHLSYTAKDGGTAFAAAVEGKLGSAT
ncbi:neuraminidase-like domain-containing protein [Pseudomonas sp. NPDC098740]|uniref:Tc toxin subunit A-related protein n=1 Tax=Pseudomonas sp. NPDC098740 TaxID=3364486 RepID=UPI00383B6A17